MTPDQYQRELSRTLAEAILLTGRDESGMTICFANEAVTELLNVAALVLHNSEECTSPAKTRALCDRLARRLQTKISEMQRLAAAGALPFVATVPERTH